MHSCVLFTGPWQTGTTGSAIWLATVDDQPVLYVRLTGLARRFLDPLGSILVIAVLENSAMLVLHCDADRSNWETVPTTSPALCLEFRLSGNDVLLLSRHALVEMQVRSVFHNLQIHFRDPIARAELMESARRGPGKQSLRRLG
ncbi:MAG: hypothetical protein IPJ76_10760 [Flavobacteriales bacterium]|nr:MAG: hypothetical protein IPJ76_10760 [Flavobacteriales bacterium]